MSDIVAGYLEVGRNDKGEIVVNHPDLKPDSQGVGHIVFSANQARNLAGLLLRHAAEAEEEEIESAAMQRRNSAAAIPVDRSARVLADGSPVSEDHRKIDSITGQQKGYVVLSAEERAKGFVHPVRLTYTHVGKLEDFENPDHPSGVTQRWSQRVGGCGTDTTMGQSIAETYARDPGFYTGTFCVQCRTHFPLDQFVWKGTAETVGS